MKKTRIFLTIFAIFGLFSSCAPAQNGRYTIVGQFDTVIEVIAPDGQKQAEQYGKQAEALLKTWHKLCDAYHAYDNVTGIYAINHAAGAWVDVERPLFDLLFFGLSGYEKTGGAVNLVGGAVTKLWKNVSVPPDKEAVMRALEHIAPESLELDEKNLRVRLSDAEAQLDVGAFAKGYALEQVAKVLEADGFSGVLNATSSVRCVGDYTAHVGVGDPIKGGYDRVAALCQTALATSGTNQRYFTYQGKNYHHIIDFTTGFPSESGVIQASVVCDDAGLADLYATAAVINGKSNVPALLYLEDGQTKIVEGWQDVTK